MASTLILVWRSSLLPLGNALSQRLHNGLRHTVEQLPAFVQTVDNWHQPVEVDVCRHVVAVGMLIPWGLDFGWLI